MSATKQIDDACMALLGWASLPRIEKAAPGTSPDWDIGADIRLVLDALTAAERERDEAVGLLREARGILPPFDLDAMRRIDAYLSAHFPAVDKAKLD